jgi:hypothetical protein
MLSFWANKLEEERINTPKIAAIKCFFIELMIF